jgi:hypothetical protein
MTLIAPTLQSFFTDRLISQRQASPRTIAAYRDTFRLLLAYLHQHTSRPPSHLRSAADGLIWTHDEVFSQVSRFGWGRNR